MWAQIDENNRPRPTPPFPAHHGRISTPHSRRHRLVIRKRPRASLPWRRDSDPVGRPLATSIASTKGKNGRQPKNLVGERHERRNIGESFGFRLERLNLQPTESRLTVHNHWAAPDLSWVDGRHDWPNDDLEHYAPRYESHNAKHLMLYCVGAAQT